MYVRVAVTPGAKKERVEARGEDELLIAVKEPAERNLANKRVIEIVAAEYGVRTGAVRIISGHHSPRKILSVDQGAVS